MVAVPEIYVTPEEYLEMEEQSDIKHWVLQTYTAEKYSFRLNSIDFEATITELYEDDTEI